MSERKSKLATASRERLQGLLRQSFIRNKSLKKMNKILTHIVGFLLTVLCVGTMVLYKSS